MENGGFPASKLYLSLLLSFALVVNYSAFFDRLLALRELLKTIFVASLNPKVGKYRT